MAVAAMRVLVPTAISAMCGSMRCDMHPQDPHFKTSNHRRRIIQTSLLAEYAYCLSVGGMLYTVTDVQELGEWMRAKLDAHPLFERCVYQQDMADFTTLCIKLPSHTLNKRHVWYAAGHASLQLTQHIVNTILRGQGVVQFWH